MAICQADFAITNLKSCGSAKEAEQSLSAYGKCVLLSIAERLGHKVSRGNSEENLKLTILTDLGYK